ncbi:bacteriophytochrome [Nitzschia inconspicua]|uniref:histidine kinase n=1 Tax=Nitzschia inconspicua TaxID=303405 RepID=A0A9K3KXJ9_9STRA|nr:bacteriophytochrome [Nitzschia inconspicua]
MSASLEVSRNMISNTELSECDREKLHLIGHIQGDSGHVFFLTLPEERVVAADAGILNVPFIYNGQNDPSNGEGDHNHDPNGELMRFLGSSLKDWISAEIYDTIKMAINSLTTHRIFRFVTHKDTQYAISVSSDETNSALTSIEIEAVAHTEQINDSFQTLTALGTIMELYADEKILTTACDTIFKLIRGYDRGMVYKFNDDLSGEVIHEIKKGFIHTSYKGMRFPASDIPLTARQLYIKNGLRYIHNVDGHDIPIVDILGTNGGQIDLTNCRMRSVSKPHVIYLRNMGVICSMSLGIVVDGKLWGLFAYHGYTEPFKPSLHQRIACESIVSMVSVKQESLARKALSHRIIHLSEALMNWDATRSLSYNLQMTGNEILHILDADVMAGRIGDPISEGDDDRFSVGDEELRPTEGFWDILTSYPKKEILAMNTREELIQLGISEDICPAAGFAYFQDDNVQIMLGRKLRSKDVKWAGNPDEPKLKIGGILNPRNSFETFMEKARKEAKTWIDMDLHVINAFMEKVFEHSHNRMLSVLSNEIEDANSKCVNAFETARANSDFISNMGQELRTPFQQVMGCLNVLHDTYDDISDEDVQDLVSTALSSGTDMINLLNDILNLSKERHLARLVKSDDVHVEALVSEPVESLKNVATTQGIEITCHFDAFSTKSVVTDKSKVQQIISNIVNNAIKFAAGGRIGINVGMASSLHQAVDLWAMRATAYSATVFTMQEDDILDSVDAVKRRMARFTVSNDKKWLLISIQDSGRGMGEDELRDMLQPYRQSSGETNLTLQGTELGLCICVSLCQQLNGHIGCSSTPGVGTLFHVGIPVEDNRQSKPKTPEGKIPETIGAQQSL